MKLSKLVSQKTKQISKTPHIFKTSEITNTKFTPLGNFSIYYKINASQIIILAFWDNRQDPKKLLLILENLK